MAHRYSLQDSFFIKRKSTSVFSQYLQPSAFFLVFIHDQPMPVHSFHASKELDHHQSYITSKRSPLFHIQAYLPSS
jgi:hypothetical protein